MLGSKISDALESDSFASSFVHLILKREHLILRKMALRWEKARWGWDYTIGNKIVCLLRGLFQRCVSQGTQKQWAGLLEAKINFH